MVGLAHKSVSVNAYDVEADMGSATWLFTYSGFAKTLE